VSEGSLLGGVLARGKAARHVEDRSLVTAMLDVEAALARAQARAGLVPVAAAEAITAACRRLQDVDFAELGAEATRSGNPIVPLVRALEQSAGEIAGPYVHLASTSQDVLDTALMLISWRATLPLLDDLAAAADLSAALAAEHRDTVMVGRTLLQHARPTTFGLKAASWTDGLDAAGDRLRAARALLPVQVGGAAGTRSGLSGRGAAVADALADELGLAPAALPWHGLRLPLLDLAAALGAVAAVAGKVALDVVLLAQDEVAEVSDGAPDRGGSSAMPHKRNPVAAVSVRAAALRVPGLVATLLTTAQLHEHERAAGAWHAEWEPLRDLVSTTGSAVAWLADTVEHLVVDTDAMRATARLSQHRTGAEQWAAALAPRLGRAAAHELVRSAVASADPGAALREGAGPGRDVDTILTEMVDVLEQTGEARQLVDAFLARRSTR
jgi:3-carboxy-cis,cis-muconate cycloisomerase